MRRAICLSEPTATYAGNAFTWKFSYTTAINLPKGARLTFDLDSQGRTIDWEIPQTDPKKKENLIWLELPNKKTVHGKPAHEGLMICSAFEFILPSDVKSGETLFFYLGSPVAKDALKKGNRAQSYIQRRRPFYLYLDPKGKGDTKDPEIFTLDVKGNKLRNIRLISPSLVSKNQRFDVLLRFEDEFGNLTGNAPEGTLIELSYEQLRENLNWKLFIPETGFLNLPNLYFNEAGNYTIQLANLNTKEKFFSAPIVCVDEGEQSIYWGSVHSESEKIDAAANIEVCLRTFRDEQSYHFYGTSSFDAEAETSHDVWKTITHEIAEFNEESRFTTFLGFQWVGEPGNEGMRQIIYLKDSRPLLRQKDSKGTNLKKIYKSHTPKDLISIPTFTMSSRTPYSFEEYNPEYERAVEIYNVWGSSECTKKEGNPKPIETTGSGINETPQGSIREALNNNHRFGFIAGGLDDRGVYHDLYESDQIQYTPGLTAIVAPQHNREALFQALYNRKCYATTGPRIVLGFFIADHDMGSELSTKSKPGLSFNRHITGFISGTDTIEQIDIIRNGVVFHTIKPNEKNYSLTLDDSDSLEKICLTPAEEPPFTYYYLRVTQKDGHIAWSSPIWIDLLPAAAPPPKKTKTAPRKK